MPDQSRPVGWKRLLAALVIFPVIGPFVLGVTVELVTAVGSLFVEPYVLGQVSFNGIFNMVWLGFIGFPPAFFLAAVFFALAGALFQRPSFLAALLATALGFAAWFVYLGMPTSVLTSYTLVLMAAFGAGIVLATAVCWGLWRALFAREP